MSSINDLIYTALVGDYGPGNVTDLLCRWMIDVGISPWSNTTLRAYLLNQTGASSTLSTNDLLATYFSGSFDVSDFRLLETGDKRLLETGDYRLLEV